MKDTTCGRDEGGRDFELAGHAENPQPAQELGVIASEVLAAYTDDCHDLTDDKINVLAGLGIPQGALQFDSDRRLFKVRAASVVFLGQDSFEFAHLFRGDQQKVLAAIIVCRDEFGDVADLCAWSPRLNATSLWIGRVGLIGEENALAPRIGDSALHVHPSIREWLTADRFGVVVVDSRRARSILHAASPLAVDTLEFGQQLRTALAGLLPPIFIEERIGGAAS